MEDLYTVVHVHRFGESVYVVRSKTVPSEEEVIELLDIDYEEVDGEWIDIIPIKDIDDLDELRAARQTTKGD